jgi:hypothetical protein
MILNVKTRNGETYNNKQEGMDYYFQNGHRPEFYIDG